MEERQMQDTAWMEKALAQAEEALAQGEIAVGCVIVKDGRCIAVSHNEREKSGDPTAHAEVLAVRRAAESLHDRYLTGCTLYVTLEPCPMCAGLLAQLRLARLVFGAYDEKCGCAGSYYDLVGDGAFGPVLPTFGGVMQEECKNILQRSLTAVRSQRKRKDERQNVPK